MFFTRNMHAMTFLAEHSQSLSCFYFGDHAAAGTNRACAEEIPLVSHIKGAGMTKKPPALTT
jgi:hypothetical protein